MQFTWWFAGLVKCSFVESLCKVQLLRHFTSAAIDHVSLIHGTSPRLHIWTYAEGLNANPATGYNLHDQCALWQDCQRLSLLSLIDNDFKCDSGNPSRNSYLHEYLYTNRLWDNSGSSCVKGSTCCDNPDQPWFKKKLSQPANEDVELCSMACE